MTVDQYIEKEIFLLKKFQLYWIEQSNADPDNWPKEDNYQDWCDEFNMFVGLTFDEFNNENE